MMEKPTMTKNNNEEHMSRARAVRVLMEIQAAAARDGQPVATAALEMAVSNIVKRHRDSCRNKAKRRAERLAAAEAQKKEVENA